MKTATQNLITLESGSFGWDFIIRNNATGETVLIQSDWDYPSVAQAFGLWTPPSNETDGTVTCPVTGMTVAQMIDQAHAALTDGEGSEVEDPGYFNS